MSDKEQEEKQQLLMDVATLDDFAHINPASVLAMSNSLHFHTLEMVFQEAAHAAKEAGDDSAVRAYNVLAVICSYHFNPDRSDAFTPQIIMGGRRSLIPSDYLGEQQVILTEIAEQVDHPLLRARIADSCWYSNKKLHTMAELASSSYLNAVESFFSKALLYQYESDFEVPSKVVDLIERAFAIYASIGKRKNTPDTAKKTFALTYQTAKDNQNLVAFHRLSSLGQSCGLIEWRDIAIEAEAMAIAAKDKQYAEAVKKVWLHAAHAYFKLGDKESSTRCKVSAVDQTLRMRDAVGSATAKASWTRDAIGELRSIGGMQEKIEVLKKELQQYEDDSLSELGEFSIPIDLTEERQATIEDFEELEVHEMLFRLAFITSNPEKIALHKNCLKKRSQYFFSSMSEKSYSDEKGKVIATVSSAPLGNNPSEEWFDYESLAEMSFHYHISVEGFIKPACMTMSRCQSIDERHLEPIAYHSAFVPPGHESVFALGFARLIQGDMISAAHTLIPQLENSLRYVLNNRGSSTAKLNIDLTQEDQSLSQMYSNRKKELEQAFGVDITYAFHLLFNLKGGPMLRHEMAHGKFTAGECHQSACIYACWLMFHLACAPLYRHWESHIARAIQEITH
ncbi:hypothetical protein SAMN04244572_00104 [Azotobacter beijerinckii]|uniref:DUF4209 domain-containing protein n=1 Tax=Azotobacter beijerinckii TaxID=170623 RepID=A0A1H6QB58_9GAMM|nr:DUF4209 domain-containing protein [Azotobacter beijerinckii]SEI40983.1 hypothetical protein SAMN04244572_00104 [Azotobacter beijerinckii]